MDRFDVRLKGGFIALLIALGLMSCGFAPFVMWLVSIRNYPKAFDAEGVTLRNGKKLPWKSLTERRKLVVKSSGGRRTVTGVGLKFGSVSVAVAPAVWIDGHTVLPYLSRILGEDLAKP